MELRHLVTFQSVVMQGSFLGAARQLDCAQSTVTLHVQQLEAALGIELFDRRTRRVRLTEAGRALHEQSGPLLGRVTALRETMAELNAGAAGHLRIGAIEPAASHRLPPILVRFHRERPNVRLSVELGGTQSIVRGVTTGALDLGICSPPLGTNDVAFEPLFREPLGLLVPDDHPLSGAETVRVADLTGHRLLVTEPACAYRELTDWTLRDRDTRPLGGIEIGSMQALSWAVQAGLGLAIVPMLPANPPPRGTVLRSLADVDLALTVGLARPIDAAPPGRLLAPFIAACRSHLGRPPAYGVKTR